MIYFFFYVAKNDESICCELGDRELGTKVITPNEGCIGNVRRFSKDSEEGDGVEKLDDTHFKGGGI